MVDGMNLHGCGDQSGEPPKGPLHLYQFLVAIYDISLDCFWLVGNGQKLRLPRSVRLDADGAKVYSLDNYGLHMDCMTASEVINDSLRTQFASLNKEHEDVFLGRN
jgi:hypothetical protein